MQNPVFNPHDLDNQSVTALSKELEVFKKDIDTYLNVRGASEMSYTQLANIHIERLGYNKVVFCNKTLLSKKEYYLIKNNSPKATPRIETVMCICIGLELGPDLGSDLLKAAGYILTNSKQHIAYRLLLSTCSGKSIYECNEILEKCGLKPLKKNE